MRSLPAAIMLVALSAQTTFAQAPGKIIEAVDGDVILVPDAARVRIVRRMEGNVRAVYNAQKRSIVVFVDQATRAKPADGRVDVIFTFEEVEGQWPLGERWDGRATVDDYSLVTGLGLLGLGVNAGQGLVQLLSHARGPREAVAIFNDPSAIAMVTFKGAGRSSGGNQTFEQAEQRQAAMAARNATGLGPFGSSVRMTTEAGGLVSGATGGVAISSAPGASGYPPLQAPVRVGGNIRTPVRTQTAEPVTPPIAQQAGIRGVVIVEVTIDPAGRVTDARILRSIPLLDAAALDAVRKWRFEPTLLNGAPVPVIMTVTVNFP
jgi:TonB family protein